MLAKLIKAHEQLLAGIAELELLTNEDAPDAGKLAQVRWRLSRASGQRRRLVEQACADLLVNASGAQAQSVRTLQENSAQMQAASSRHIGAWAIEQVIGDWQGYRQASIAMRKAMRARIKSEQSILYPLLAPPTP